MAKKKKDGVEIKLGFKDRAEIPKLFPGESDILTLVIVGDISKKIAFTSAESKNFESAILSNGSKGYKWEKSKNIVVSFTKAEMEFLKARIETLDKQKKLTQDMLATVLKIRDCNVE
jgi:hypothetical protein